MKKRATQTLEEEHHIIQKVVGVMAILVEELDKGKELEVGVLRDMVEFMQVFADKCHHGKEEGILFPLLESKGVPVNGCPLGILIHEHQNGRKLVAELGEATGAYARGKPEGHDLLRTSLQGLVSLYPNHIWKEDYLLFPMTDKILNKQEQQDLVEKFELVERSIGLDVHHRFEQLAVTLAEK
ncbi:hemerythrin domain-containing protein [Geobacter pelophilus]|uniref:Hemerythrin domain-containing protein n=1 Tax=Geoanaerobacter pelophilus TaxID=60036 RepID=A0AAW4L3G6_9BACT|nr:hemerythrin domain-containing protein [Geoanaerobacter pelophilus]MBT0665264.1 hemerythrin domain-containing protein [Geoanaerobacter pelophilus]